MSLAVVDATTLRQQYLSLLEEKATRQATRSLRAFIAQAWPIVEPAKAFTPNWHIDAIADHLEAVSRREIANLVINVPPGCMKSFLVSVLWPAWEWASHPELRYLCASFDQGLSTRDAQRVRGLVQSEWYQARWPHVQLAEDQNQKTRFNTTAGGWRIATTVRGRALGEHPHRKIIDDPHSLAEAHSAQERRVAIDFYDQTLSTRGAALDAATVLIGQRLHQLDLSGHILSGPDRRSYVHLCLPMRFEPQRMAQTPLGWNDPRTTAGELLWPAMFSETIVANLEVRLGSYGAAGQLQQRPAPPEGGLIKRVWWKYYQAPPLPAVDEIVLSVDTALKDKKLSDFWSCQAWGRRGADCFLVRRAHGRWDLIEGQQQIRDMYRWVRDAFPGVGVTTLIENAAAGPDVIAGLKREIPGIVGITPKGDKVQRVFAVTPVLEAGNVWVPGAALPNGEFDQARTPAWVQDVLAECAAFPNGAHDDDVDALSQALLRLTSRVGGVAIVKVGDARRPARPSPATTLARHSPGYSRADLDELEALVAAHGSQAVETIRRTTRPTFTLPAHLRGVDPPNGHGPQHHG